MGYGQGSPSSSHGESCPRRRFRDSVFSWLQGGPSGAMWDCDEVTSPRRPATGSAGVPPSRRHPSGAAPKQEAALRESLRSSSRARFARNRDESGDFYASAPPSTPASFGPARFSFVSSRRPS